MKQKILMEKNESTFFKGKMLNMPIKQSKIIEKSLELFDDDDPCIIHTSFIIKHFSEQLSKIFEKEDTKTINANDFASDLDFIDIDDLQGLIIHLK